jgi:hypothetical protein
LIVRTKRSAYALRFGERGGRRTTSTPPRCEGLPKTHGEQRIPIVSQIALASETAVVDIRHVATDLAHPRGVGLRGDPGDLDVPRREFDDEQYGKPGQAAPGPDVHGEEVRGGEDLPMRPQELDPGRLLQPLGRGVQAVFAEDVAIVPRETS